ncbi:MAG: lysophospholipid acyltransferase family protein [Bacteroidota bacterium]|nr:lysophospholipid acyltransferase family protein [Bacteroidota bacterium]
MAASLKIVSIHLFFFIFTRKSHKKVLASIMHRWCRNVTSILRVRIETTYAAQFHEMNFLLVANHQSYFDIVVIGSVFPTLFLAKKEVQHWPIIGLLATLVGTLFIDRRAFRGAVTSVQEICEALHEGASVQIFPEGTSTDGSCILPFKPSLMKAAVDAYATILPVTINYRYINDELFSVENRDIICWYGDMEFGNHFWKLLNQDSIEVSLSVHAPIRPPHPISIQELTQSVYEKVSSNFLGVEEKQVNENIRTTTREVFSSLSV